MSILAKRGKAGMRRDSDKYFCGESHMAENVIIITTDLSEESSEALTQGIQHAKMTNAEVKVLYVAQKFELPVALQRQLNDPEAIKNMELTYQEDEEKLLAQFLAAHNVSDGVDPIVEFSEEPASEIICQYAKSLDARLIVMASQGKGTLGRIFLGSNTQKVVAQASCPILIIPAHKEDESS